MAIVYYSFIKGDRSIRFSDKDRNKFEFIAELHDMMQIKVVKMTDWYIFSQIESFMYHC